MAEILNPTKESISKAAALLESGGLAAFPTQTVYGLGADAFSDHAVAEVFSVKGRPSFNPLIIHVADIARVYDFAEVTTVSKKLMESFFPAPLTLVLKRKPGCKISYLASAGLDTVAVRMPSHPVALDLIKTFGRPIAAPSANKSGSISPTTAEHVEESLGERIRIILDGGPCRVGLESTVLYAAEDLPVLLRPGGVTVEEIEARAGKVAAPSKDSESPMSPGQLSSHYAPSKPVRLNAKDRKEGEALLGFGRVENADMNLSISADLTEAAANLFDYLRKLDASSCRTIAVSPIPVEKLGLAINDRLKRAAFSNPDNNKEGFP